ncbi:hypothetical protein BH09ACT12_BH09ACT12_11990 [soil metagenome]
MTRTRSAISVLIALAVAGLMLSPVAEASAAHGPGRPAPTMKVSSRSDAKTQVQHVKLKWKGSKRRQSYTEDAVVPGIGDLKLICKPNKTMVRLYTPDRQYETQMWLQKYEDKNYGRAVAVKTPRVYQYATADDNGKGGTGFYTHEGLNQQGDVENYAKGFMNGVISQRSGRNPSVKSAQLSSPKPVTSFELTWYWNGFDQPKDYQFCKIDIVLTTVFDERMSLTWHGDAHADGNEQAQFRLPGVGDLDVDCPSAGSARDQSFTVTPDHAGTQDDPAELYVEVVTGEGRVEDQVEYTTFKGVDEETGGFPAIELPRNGTVRFKVTDGDGDDRWVLMSSYFVVNNAKHPELNLCEFAAAQYDANFT